MPPDGREGKLDLRTIKAVAVWLPLVVPYKTMHNLKVQIVHLSIVIFPMVECELVDAEGAAHLKGQGPDIHSRSFRR